MFSAHVVGMGRSSPEGAFHRKHSLPTQNRVLSRAAAIPLTRIAKITLEGAGCAQENR